MTNYDIDKMVSRFLRWKIPEDFFPDGGISFKPTFNGINGSQIKAEPSGTNLFTYSQAKEMVLYMLANDEKDSGQIAYHCANGPAIVYSSTNEWWYCGKRYTFDQWCDVANISAEEKVRLAAIYH